MAKTAIIESHNNAHYNIRKIIGLDLKTIAQKEGVSINALFRVALLEYLERNDLLERDALEKVPAYAVMSKKA